MRCDTAEEIRQRAQILAQMIRESEEAARYRACRQKIARNGEVQSLLKSQKRLQMSVSALKMRCAPVEKIRAAERALAEVEERLRAIPVVGQYQAAQEEVNLLVQGVAEIIAHTISSRLPVEVSAGGCSGGCGGCTTCGVQPVP
ncbi:RicAFT regulatory complex protein RicA family protein [Kyrpidia tusciae]|uniref:YlbF family regulator n=1 Tax=Kyrpidia tusciae (strain DSM 2912 / NBRC 15312 / T2) TaxID=562970 RepID=D5WPS2_KYRT2|nr:YlbF family regulator [Kyrpidia tusciae]ADG06331.1 protein of unknown function DUF1333 [Kyrpidia tusciae DSM 2912]